MKKLLYTLLAVSIIFSACEKEDEEPTKLAIGDSHQGGIIFYLDGNGGGLIAASSDQAPHPTGAQWVAAVNICSALTFGGYSDWLLPSKNQLFQMFVNKGAIDSTAIANGGSSFDPLQYWSSTDIDNSTAWSQNFNSGGQGQSFKISFCGARAIRAF